MAWGQHAVPWGWPGCTTRPAPQFPRALEAWSQVPGRPLLPAASSQLHLCGGAGSGVAVEFREAGLGLAHTGGGCASTCRPFLGVPTLGPLHLLSLDSWELGGGLCLHGRANLPAPALEAPCPV